MWTWKWTVQILRSETCQISLGFRRKIDLKSRTDGNQYSVIMCFLDQWFGWRIKSLPFKIYSEYHGPWVIPDWVWVLQILQVCDSMHYIYMYLSLIHFETMIQLWPNLLLKIVSSPRIPNLSCNTNLLNPMLCFFLIQVRHLSRWSLTFECTAKIIKVDSWVLRANVYPFHLQRFANTCMANKVKGRSKIEPKLGLS